MAAISSGAGAEPTVSRPGPPSCFQVILSTMEPSGHHIYMSPEVVAQLIGVLEHIKPERLILLGDNLESHPLWGDITRVTKHIGIQVISIALEDVNPSTLNHCSDTACMETVCIDVEGYVYDCLEGLREGRPLGGGGSIHLSMLPDIQFKDMLMVSCPHCAKTIARTN